jgi:hypothetical protein
LYLFERLCQAENEILSKFFIFERVLMMGWYYFTSTTELNPPKGFSSVTSL